MKTDRASMAHSLEARVPFLDPVVDELRARAADARRRCAACARRCCCARPSAPLLPREIVHGRKRGFSIPAAAWLRGELEPFARETLSPETLRRQGYFEPAAVTRVLDDHVAGREDLLAASSGGCSRSRSGTSATSSASRGPCAEPRMVAQAVSRDASGST